MADAPDDTTGWVSFFYYCRRRAARIVPDTAREQEAERLTLGEVLKGELELRWQDVDGRDYIGLPRDWSRWYAYYDQSADAIRQSPFPYAPALYQPQVRERRRKLANPADTTAIEPQQVTPPPSPMSVEPTTTGLAIPVEGGEHRERNDRVKLDESTDQWPWRKDPALRQDDGSEPRRIQLQCEQKLRPSIQHDSDAKIRKALEKVGVSASDSSIRRAFGRP